MFSIWHDIGLMQKVARALWRVAAALLVFAGLAWVLQQPYFAINQFRFVGDVEQLDEARLHGLMNKHLTDGLAGGFFSMDLNSVESSLKDISWVKSTSIRRVWPHEIEVSIEAYKPVAVWQAGGFLSSDGQVFEANVSGAQKSKLLITEGPAEASKLVADFIPKFTEWLKPMGLTMSKLSLSERYSWRVVLSNGLEIEFGREDTPTVLEERVRRLQQSAKFVLDNISENESHGYIDLRYPNGFAMRSESLHRVSNGAEINKQLLSESETKTDAKSVVKTSKSVTKKTTKEVVKKPRGGDKSDTTRSKENR
ncbi:cell division protein FtsQ [Formosimonas limnophila]|uniref:Cell division protein FtsQ n=1 Tax=Formosimonas limnophila TaxID=1384487 RepID=A0A8J3CL85_9BURK|nr:cell division protein FtsQ/DivIB [Formosimonas limnophila]GHA72524.1 cell division protein FtsQ [Formosimonas limnophila]